MNKIRLWLRHHRKHLVSYACIVLAVVIIVLGFVLTFGDVY